MMAIMVAEGTVDAMTWQELAAHAGIAGLEAKAVDEFEVDASLEWGARVYALQAEIDLTEAEWQALKGGGSKHLLGVWSRKPISEALWKATVQLGWPDGLKTKVDASGLKEVDPHVIVHGVDPVSTRLYVLPEGKAGQRKLFYFFRHGWKPE
ncbi:MAG TPA: hypothetical protein VD994_06980 [Prosthecobacter sp.]|nr:hypothetical protein [Prosthecobacter sp.]